MQRTSLLYGPKSGCFYKGWIYGYICINRLPGITYDAREELITIVGYD